MPKKHRIRNAILGSALALFITGGVGRRTPALEVQNTLENTVTSELHVMSANVARGEGDDANILDIVLELFRLSKKPQGAFRALDALIEEEKIDIACFQEIEYTIQGTHQTKERAERTSLQNYVFGPNFVHEFLGLYRFADGNAVISKFPLYNTYRESLDSHKKFSLSTISEFFAGSKSILSTTIKYHNRDITLICTHLSNWDTEFSSEKERDAELEAVFRYAAAHTPAMIMGDLNTVPLSAQNRKYEEKDYREERGWERVKKLVDELNLDVQYDPRLALFSKTATCAFPGTYNGVVPEFMLGEPNYFPDSGKVNDYIIVVNNLQKDIVRLELLDTKVANDRFYSDHLPVIATIKINELMPRVNFRFW